MPDLVSNFDPGPGEPLLKSEIDLDMPSFASDCDILQMPDFVNSINLGHRETSPESGDVLAVPDFVNNMFGCGGPIPGDGDSCHSVMCTSPPDSGGDDVSSLSVTSFSQPCMSLRSHYAFDTVHPLSHSLYYSYVYVCI